MLFSVVAVATRLTRLQNWKKVIQTPISIGIRAISFVVRGLIYGIDVRQELEIAEINVKITKILRHSTDDLYGSSIVGFSTVDNGINYNSSEEEEVVKKKKFSENDVVKLVMPRQCHPHRGPGEFVFMGRQRLGDLSLVCAARLSEWATIVRTFNSDGTSHCVLKS
ncbi:hypothetical protein RUM44_010958 [Polyplax serrata]|uniref:Uncharacterized protein n=1 Tax=Polyplax serrata TaxID=468196 RepID=A0ABR1ANN4_POLSC